MDTSELRPLERRVLAMRDQGLDIEEIARRLRKRPDFVERVIRWTQIPRASSSADQESEKSQLTPLERRVLDLRANGEDHQTIADRFKRSARFIRQVEGLAHFRKGMGLLDEAAAKARDKS